MIDRLKDNQILKQLDVFSDLMIEQDLIPESRELVHLVEGFFRNYPAFFKSDNALSERYNTYLIKAKLVHLFDLDENEIYSIIEKRFKLILSLPEYEVYRKIRLKLLDMYELEKRDEFKDKIRESLLKNQEVITEHKIKINNLDQSPTIGHWLKDYYSKIGLEPADSLSQNQYLVNSVNTKKLDAKDKEKIKNLIDFFEKMKLSSLDREGLEESFVIVSSDQEMSFINQGRIEKVDPEVVRLCKNVLSMNSHENKSAIDGINKKTNTFGVLPEEVDLEKALDSYSPESFEHRVIQQEINRLKKNK